MVIRALSQRLGQIALLLVEDSADDAELVIDALRTAGLSLQVTTVDTEAAFVAGLGKGPDIVISDLDLPHFDGKRALSLRSELAPETPLIVVSGTVTDEQAADVLRLGATDYLLKDRAGRLASAVLRAVDARRTLDARRVAEQAHHDVAARWETLVSNSTDILAVVDKHLRLVYANDALVSLLGHELDDVLGRGVLDFVHPDDLDSVAEAVGEAMARDGIGVPVIARLATAGGDFRYVESIGNSRLQDPNIKGLVVNGRDVTERVEAERLLTAEVMILERVASEDPPGVVFGLIASVMQNGSEHCRAEFEFASEHFTYRFACQHLADDAPELYPLVINGTAIGRMTVWRRPDRSGTPFIPMATSTAVRLAVVVAQGQIARSQLVHQATHDPLTGLGNRGWFSRQFDAALAESVDTTVLIIDVDKLQWINEGLGYSAGDHLMVTLAERFSACLSATETLARTGGDEFSIIRPSGAGQSGPQELADRLLALSRRPISWEGMEFATSVSIGVATSVDSLHATELMASAHVAVELAKRSGRDRVAFASPSRRAEVEARLTVSRELRAGVPRGELVCFLQPVINLASGAVHAAEALVRWQHPTRGLLAPGVFLPVAAQSNLLREVDRWMLDAACATRAEADFPSGVTISVNASMTDLLSSDFAERVIAILARYNLPPTSIALEVTESDAMADLASVRRNLAGLRGAGIAIHLDDFGTGYSSLSCLHQLPLDAIKIDQSFVGELLGNVQTRALVEAILAMARALRLTTIAEGVETQAQADLLARMGVDYAQGYLYSRPCSIPDFRGWVAHRRAASAAMGSPGRSGVLVARRMATGTVAAVAVDPEAFAARVAAGRALLRVEAVEEAVGVCIALVRDLGGWTVPARLDDGSALAIDVSFGHGEPLLPVADAGLARLRLERILPEVLEDARAAIARIRRQDDVQGQAQTDPLTGLLNRRAMDPILLRAGADDLLILFDLDNFKGVNDTLGHQAGDDLLIAFSRALRDRSRAGDYFGRLGGDEVLAVLSTTNAEGLDTFARRLEATWTLNRPHDVTYSAGAAWVGDRQPHDALAAADAALYAAKHAGRNRLVVDAARPSTIPHQPAGLRASRSVHSRQPLT